MSCSERIPGAPVSALPSLASAPYPRPEASKGLAGRRPAGVEPSHGGGHPGFRFASRNYFPPTDIRRIALFFPRCPGWGFGPHFCNILTKQRTSRRFPIDLGCFVRIWEIWVRFGPALDRPVSPLAGRLFDSISFHFREGRLQRARWWARWPRSAGKKRPRAAGKGQGPRQSPRQSPRQGPRQGPGMQQEGAHAHRRDYMAGALARQALRLIWERPRLPGSRGGPGWRWYGVRDACGMPAMRERTPLRLHQGERPQRQGQAIVAAIASYGAPCAEQQLCSGSDDASAQECHRLAAVLPAARRD